MSTEADRRQAAYREAQARIASARERRVTTLELSRLSLATLPPEIGSLTALQSLELDGNPLATLPPEIGSLTALQRLSLRGNQLATLAPEIGSLTALQSLELDGNPLATLPPEIGSLTALQRLSLRGNPLATLPPEIGSLTALRTLDLRGNQLATLPPAIGSLTALQTLHLSVNQLATLPPEIGSLTALQTLVLYNNQLATLPPEIGSLTALRTLDLRGNQLATLPPEIGALTALERLFLSGNQLATLPPEIGALTALQTLLLDTNQVATLPPEIGSLTALQRLSLSDNQVATLPPEIGSLTALQTLHLDGNQLATLPPEIGSLTALQTLVLSGNQLATLPPEIGSLTALQRLSLRGNQLATLPPEIGSLTALQTLSLSGNQLATLPPEIGSFTALRTLLLDNNRLASLPPEVSSLKKLRVLAVGGNPLPPEVLRLSGGRSGKGTKLIKFLRSTTAAPNGKIRTKRFDEAKVLLLGPGDVGKTWLLQALQGQVPRDKGSTKGIEIVREPLDISHPSDPNRPIRLNCWDFGGQDHFQITHQIFFSSRAIYLLIWKPRPGLDPDLVSRLERIRLSAGRTAKVMIVSTHADGNVPAVIGTDALKEQFGDLIWGFYAVDSKAGPAGTGIAVLRGEIAKAVAQLEGLDLEYPLAWHKAREAVLGTGEKTLNFGEFARICKKSGMDAEFTAAFAQIMEVQGKAVFFADAADDGDPGQAGDNLVVLDPEWLAKAIGFVIEDKPTIHNSGILHHGRLKAIWAKSKDCPGYDAALHGYLLWLMWRFDIAYRQDAQTSLVPELIGRNRPDDLYWTPAKASSGPEATLICRIPHDPPIGLIPALTAAVHPLRRVRDAAATDRLDRNWRNGFFLDTALRGAAFVELRDRDLRIVVRDGYPANLVNKVRETLNEIVKVRWPQLDVDYRVPCIGKGQGKPCTGTHRQSWLESQRGQGVSCEDCGRKDLKAEAMLDGFDAREEAIMESLRQLETGQQDILASAHAIFQSVAPDNEERTRAPNMFTIFPDKGKWFETATHESVRVTCWCEHPDGPHPAAVIGSGEAPDYLLKMPREWVVKSAPYISWAAVLIKAFVPLAGTVVQQGLGGVDIKDSVALMNDVAKAIPSGTMEEGHRGDLDDMHRHRPEIVALRHLHDFLLDKVSADKRWGDLRPILTKSGQILWLCEKHAAIQQPPVQKT